MAETTDQYRTRINQLNASIKSEPYIEKMRSDIAEGVSKTGNRQADLENNHEAFKSDLGGQFQNVIDETTGKDFTSAPEIIAARKSKPNLNARLEDFEQSTTAQFQHKADLSDIDATNLNLLKKATKEELAIEKTRINNLVANAGNTEGNAELLDARIDFEGVTQLTVGDSVRAVGDYLNQGKGVLSCDYTSDLKTLYPAGLNAPIWVKSENAFYSWEKTKNIFKMITPAIVYNESGGGGWKGNQFNVIKNKMLSEILVSTGGVPVEWELWRVLDGKLNNKLNVGVFSNFADESGYLTSGLLLIELPVGSYIIIINYTTLGAKHITNTSGTFGDIYDIKATGIFYSKEPTAGSLVNSSSDGYAYDTKLKVEGV